jgi:hypothetical protein
MKEIKRMISGSETVINYGSGSDSARKKVTVPVSVPVPQHCFLHTFFLKLVKSSQISSNTSKDNLYVDIQMFCLAKTSERCHTYLLRKQYFLTTVLVYHAGNIIYGLAIVTMP